MANYKVTDTELIGIADAIRTKGGTSASMVFPSGFISAIENISAGAVLGSKSIVSNGTYSASADGLDGFSEVVVDVPTPSGSISISANGTYDVSAYANAVVDVGGGGGSGDTADFIIERRSGYYSNSTASFIAQSVFSGHNRLTGVTFGAVEIIKANAFQYCASLQTAEFPECTDIYDDAFSACTNLSSISFPKLQQMSQGAFFETRLSEVYLPSCTLILNNAFAYCKSLTTVDMPELRTAGTGCFRQCFSLSSVNIPKCSLVMDYAFESCSSLTSIELASCSIVSSAAFRNCVNLSYAYLPVCSIIRRSAFMGCSTLSKIVLLYGSVLSMEYSVFYSTPMLNSSYLGYFGSIYVPSSLVDAYKASYSVYADRITAYEGE